MEPVSLKFRLELPVSEGSNFNYIDISQIASLVNRKFLRQGLNWVVSNVELWSDGDTQMTVGKLPDTWVMANSWTKCFELWKESRDQVLDIDGPGIQGKYADFKIFFDSSHQAAGIAGNALPAHFAIADVDGSYDWEASIYEIPNDPVSGTTTGYNLHALGPSIPASKGMIAGYAASRVRPNPESPNVVDVASPEGWMREVFDVGENLDEIRENLETLNDQPPYLIGNMEVAAEFYPGGSEQAVSDLAWLQDILVTRRSTSLNADSTGAFLAPCGLLKLATNTPTGGTIATSNIVFIEVSPGPVRGFLAQPMQEMN